MVHSTRSKWATFGPDVHSSLPSGRGTYLSNLSYTLRAPGTRSSATNRNGPLPTISVICLNGSVFASRSGIISGFGVVGLPNACGSSGNGFFSLNWIVLSSGAESSSVAAISAPPNASRAAQRLMLATQSRANTLSPSCQTNPSRNVSVQSLPSFSTKWPASICGEEVNVPSWPYSVSNTM